MIVLEIPINENMANQIKSLAERERRTPKLQALWLLEKALFEITTEKKVVPNE